MSINAYFSFHYEDLRNADIIRSSVQPPPSVHTGFYSKKIWEDTQKKGDDAIKRLIDQGLGNTDVTIILVGAKTHRRRWCKYELSKSLAARKWILGIHLPNQMESGSSDWLRLKGIPVFEWDRRTLLGWIKDCEKKGPPGQAESKSATAS